MEPLDRYLKAVRFWLPRSHRDDIVAELSEDLRAQITERQAEVGRPLTNDEIKAVLHRRGSPLAVAGGYLPQQFLIGPALFPAYWFTLKLLAWVYLLPWLAVWVGLLIFDAEYRAKRLGAQVIDDLWNLAVQALAVFAVVTLIFAHIERRQVSQGMFGVRQRVTHDPRAIPRSSSALELLLNVFFTGAWLELANAMLCNAEPGSVVRMAPIWHTLYWPILLLLVAGIALAIIRLVWPSPTQVHLGFSLARAVAGLVLAGILLAAGPWLAITASDRPAEELANFQKCANLQVFAMLCLIGIACAFATFRDTRGVVRASRSPGAGRFLVTGRH